MMRTCDTPTPSAPSTALDELAASVVREGTAPVAAVGWGAWRADTLQLECGGHVHGVFDLASVSKSFTAVALARSGRSPSSRLAELLPELAGTPAGAATLEQLLSHRAGLVAHLELFAPLRDGVVTRVDPVAARETLARARRPECQGPIPAAGFPAVYSDLGPILVGEALARHLGVVDAGAAIERLVVEPLGLAASLGSARALGPTAAYVPTETTTWRAATPLTGIVHDENAMVLTGRGASGHAGMFATLPALLRFGLEVLRMLAGEGPLVCAEPPTWLVAERPGSTWRAGFDGKSALGSSAGESASPRTFGHLGFTGTSLWIDPERRVVTSLLCNRVAPSRHYTAPAGGIKVTRPRVHETLWELAARSQLARA